MQVGEHDQYIVRMKRSRRLSLRNRKFLRKIKPYNSRLFGADPSSFSYNPFHTTVLGKKLMESTKLAEEAPQGLYPAIHPTVQILLNLVWDCLMLVLLY